MNAPAATVRAGSRDGHVAVLAERRSLLSDTCSRIFAARGDFVAEIGCGHGHFLAAYGAAHPGALCVGVDIEAGRIERANRKRASAALANVHFLHAEAADFLASLPAHARFRAVFLMFPDPWPKRRHHKHRLMRASFLGDLAARAGEGARLYFRTDDRPYFAAARSALEAHPAWRLADEPWPFEAPSVFQGRAAAHYSLAAAKSSS